MRPVTTPQREMGKDPSLRVGLYYLSSSIERSHHMTMLCVCGVRFTQIWSLQDNASASQERHWEPLSSPPSRRSISCAKLLLANWFYISICFFRYTVQVGLKDKNRKQTICDPSILRYTHLDLPLWEVIDILSREQRSRSCPRVRDACIVASCSGFSEAVAQWNLLFLLLWGFLQSGFVFFEGTLFSC